MATAPTLPLVSVEDYVNGPYEEFEYVDGVLVPRRRGNPKHSRLCALIIQSLGEREAEYGFKTYPELFLNVTATRFRVPDICVYAPGVVLDPDATPSQTPLAIVEVISPTDLQDEILEKCQDYRHMGCNTIIWADPQHNVVFVVSPKGLYLQSETLAITIPIKEGKMIGIDFGTLFGRL